MTNRAVKQSWVYFVQYGEDGPIKIGTATNLKKRLGWLQVAAIDNLYLRAAIPGDQKDEIALHRRFATCRLRGEWFEPTADLMKIIDNAPADVTAGVVIRQRALPEERLAYDDAREIWLNKRLKVGDALAMMPGWTFNTAYKEFGRRYSRRGVTSDVARDMAKRSAEIRMARSVVRQWTDDNPTARKRLATYSAVWKSRKFRNWEQARDALPDDLQGMSRRTLERIFGGRT